MEIKVPSVGESITSGILGAWKVADGDYVKSGDVLLEIETDKVTSEVYAEASGQVSQSAKEGDEVEVGQVIGKIDESAKAPSGNQADKKAAKNTESSEASAREEMQESGSKEQDDSKGRDDSTSRPPEKSTKTAEEKNSDSSRDSADKADHPESAADNKAALAAQSPAVRRLLEEYEIDPDDVEGSGKNGRILKADVLNYVEGERDKPQGNEATSTPPAPSTASPAPSSSERTSVQKMSPLRRKIADRLVAAQHTAAMLTTFNEVDLSAVIALRKKHQDAFVNQHGIKLGFMSLFTKAVIYALKQVPAINARIEGDSIVYNHFFDIGIAMSTARGLLVPVVRECDQLSLAGIEQEIAAYGKKAKEGKIQMNDLEGGVFTITNGGIFGSMLSTPILNPPQSGILGMHSIQERPVAINGQIVIRPMMYLALTYDHRIVDGKEAVTFLVNVKNWIENPGVELLDL